jgi:hypothetical protein
VLQGAWEAGISSSRAYYCTRSSAVFTAADAGAYAFLVAADDYAQLVGVKSLTSTATACVTLRPLTCLRASRHRQCAAQNNHAKRSCLNPPFPASPLTRAGGHLGSHQRLSGASWCKCHPCHAAPD